MIPSRPQYYDRLRGRAQRFRASKKPSFDEATLHKVLAGWGPGKFDATLFLDGKGFRPKGNNGAYFYRVSFGNPDLII